jgi:hypothetical protein
MGYEYAVSTSPNFPTTGAVTTGTTINMNGLNSGTKYYLYVRAICAPGLLSNWAVTPFNTLCAQLSTISISNLNYTTATLNWTATASASGYEYAVNTNPVPPTTGTPVTATSVALNNLSPATNYYAHVRVKCAAGNYSDWMTVPFTTLTCNTIAATVSNVDYSSALVSWNASQNVEGYEFLVSPVATPPMQGTPTTDTNYAADNLLPNTTYYVHLRSKCTNNIYSAWSTVSFNTMGCVAPNNITVNSITQTSATVSWTAVNTAASYDYAVTPNGAAPINTTNVSTNTVTLSELSANTTYNLHVRAVCTNVYKSAWETVLFRTSDNKLSVNNINNDNSIQVYPNPARDAVTVKTSSKSGTVTLTDIAGRTLKTITLNSEETTVDISNLNTGIYLMKYSDGHSSQTIKITKE